MPRYRRRFSVLALGLMAASMAIAPALAQTADAPMAGLPPADARPDPGFGGDADVPAASATKLRPSGVAAQMASWISLSGDNAAEPFMIVDKLGAKVFAFDADGQLIGAAPALLGLARGDDSAPGIGNMALGAINPEDRTTPAGRFEAKFGDNTDGHGTVLWIDYDNAISMHPVITSNPAEHRLARIKSASADEHRISFGCINVPAAFFAHVVQKAFAGGGIVYVLPDTKPIEEVFPTFAGLADPYDKSPVADEGCTRALHDEPDRIPDPQPSLTCGVTTRETMAAGQ